MGSCVSLNYCNRGQSSRSRDGRNNRDTPECNPQETADVSPAPVTPVNSGNTGYNNCPYYPKFDKNK